MNSRKHYQQMWQRYSQDIQASTPVKFDYLVSRKAFENGHSPKDIALMLTAGSSYVAQIHQEQGKNKARAYVNQTTKTACQKEQNWRLSRGKRKEKQLEL